jgi:hypothetical protein
MFYYSDYRKHRHLGWNRKCSLALAFFDLPIIRRF